MQTPVRVGIVHKVILCMLGDLFEHGNPSRTDHGGTGFFALLSGNQRMGCVPGARRRILVGEAWSALSSQNRRCCNAVGALSCRLDASAAVATTTTIVSLSACHDPGTQIQHGQRSILDS